MADITMPLWAAIESQIERMIYRRGVELVAATIAQVRSDGRVRLTVGSATLSRHYPVLSAGYAPAVGDTVFALRKLGGYVVLGEARASDSGGLYLPVSGGTMAGDINMGGYFVGNLGVPTAVGHATRKDYVDDADAGKLDKSGGAISGNLDISGNLNLSGNLTPNIDTGFFTLLGNGSYNNITHGFGKHARWITVLYKATTQSAYRLAANAADANEIWDNGNVVRVTNNSSSARDYRVFLHK